MMRESWKVLNPTKNWMTESQETYIIPHIHPKVQHILKFLYPPHQILKL